MKLADLHLHTLFSDGTFSPQQLVQEAQKAGLSCIAVTDHDTVAGVEPATEAAANSLEVIAGVELTAEFYPVRDKTPTVPDDCLRQPISNGANSTEIHILGYFIDINSLKLNNQLEKIRNCRRNRVYDILEKLKKMGIELDPRDVFKTASSESVGRLHIAKAMLDKGIISNIYEAFYKYIGDECPAYVSKFSLSPKDAISLIADAGGVSVLAHPYSPNCDELIPSLVKARLRGIEAYYPEYTQAVRDYYLKIAEKYELLVTGGSDCHGSLKPDITVGKISVPYNLVEKLREAKNNLKNQ